MKLKGGQGRQIIFHGRSEVHAEQRSSNRCVRTATRLGAGGVLMEAVFLSFFSFSWKGNVRGGFSHLCEEGGSKRRENHMFVGEHDFE